MSPVPAVSQTVGTAAPSPCAGLFPERGQQLSQALAEDRVQRERLRKGLERKLAWGRRVEWWGRNGCVAAGLGIALLWACTFLSFMSGSFWLWGAILYGTLGLVVGSPLVAAAGRAWCRWVVRRASMLAIDDLEHSRGGKQPSAEAEPRVPSRAQAEMQQKIDAEYAAEIRTSGYCLVMCSLGLGLAVSIGLWPYPGDIATPAMICGAVLLLVLLPVVAVWRVNSWAIRREYLRQAAAEGLAVYDPAAAQDR